ncbi:dolichyldiphosphatase [Fusarium albosuccineum]|uniref:Dolichyldiphosphatase n=1 Tax=Fusarium albosuccineum TaxID=1237068 RepID=A0A8H4PDB7_9HYPO|nr:dolichyldiphosphatase [Fusarium albosuccineum]
MDDDTTPLASLSVTHVYYDPHDKLSLICAYLALLPQALCVVYATLVLFTREVEVALMFAGQLACEAINFALKRLIKEERPRRIHGKGYGMPSSHAQFVAFWSVSLALFLLVRHRPPKVLRGRAQSSVHRPWSVPERLAVSVAGAVIAAVTAWSRVYLNYHTARQVIVGCVAGVISAVGWFVIVAVVRQTGWLGWALETRLSRAFRVRDLVVEEDMCQAGWEKWEERRTTSSKKKIK